MENLGLRKLSYYRAWLYQRATQDPHWKVPHLLPAVADPYTLQVAQQWVMLDRHRQGRQGDGETKIERRFLQEKLRRQLLGGYYEPRRSSFLDRVVQAALCLVLEPLWEGDFSAYQDRPDRWPPQAVEVGARAISERKTRMGMVDVRPWLRFITHEKVLQQVAERVGDPCLLQLLRRFLCAYFTQGVGLAPRGTLFAFLSNLVLRPIDSAVASWQTAVREGAYDHLTYARCRTTFAVWIDGHPRWDGLWIQIQRELHKIGIEQSQMRYTDLEKPRTFCIFADFQIHCSMRQTTPGKRRYCAYRLPSPAARTALCQRIRTILRTEQGCKVGQIVSMINPFLQDFADYFRAGNTSRCFHWLADWVECQLRRRWAKEQGCTGLGWQRWPKAWFYEALGLYHDYAIRRQVPFPPRQLRLDPLPNSPRYPAFVAEQLSAVASPSWPV